MVEKGEELNRGSYIDMNMASDQDQANDEVNNKLANIKLVING